MTSSTKQMWEWMLDKFWEVWFQEYIQSLPPGGSGHMRQDIKTNNVVIICEDNGPMLL